jgi:Flp pilus assembly protein TadG
MKFTKRGEKGNAILEFGLIVPLLAPLLLVVFDFGMYAYAFISVENAARVVAARNSGGPDTAGDQATGCAMAIQEVQGMPNIGASFSTPCTASPLIVTSVLCSGTGACGSASATADGQPAVAVTVSYNMPPVFQFPILGPVTITRGVQMKIRSLQ